MLAKIGLAPTVLVVVAAPLTTAAVVLALLAAITHGGTLWWAFALAAGGAVVFLGSAARGRYAAAGVVALAAAAVLSGLVVWRAPSTSGIEKLLGIGAPSTLTATTWLLLVLVTVLTAAIAFWRAELANHSARTWCALLAVAAVLAASAATGAWLGGRGLVSLRESMIAGGIDEHTVDPSADPGLTPRRAPVTGPAELRTRWERQSSRQVVVGTSTAEFVVSATTGADDRSGIAVHDSRTGAERWHFQTRLFGISDGVAVSPSADRVLVLIGAAAVLFDLDSGTEVSRIELPAPTREPAIGLAHYQVLGPHPHGRAYGDEQPQVELAGNVVHIAVTGSPGATDVLTVDLINGQVWTVASSVPEYCRFRALRAAEYVGDYDFETWLLRDGVGCGAPTLTNMFRGLPQTETPLPDACAPAGCELVDAYATGRDVVVQTERELLAFDTLGALTSRTPVETGRRSVILPEATDPTVLPSGVVPRENAVFARDGAVSYLYRADGAGGGQVVAIDSATGQEQATSDTVACTEPATLSIALDVVVLSCVSEVTAFG